MRWPITRLSLANDTSVVCPLCMYGYILPDSPEGDGHVTGIYACLYSYVCSYYMSLYYACMATCCPTALRVTDT